MSLPDRRPRKQRLDHWLVAHGHAESREKAQALVMAGRVQVNGAHGLKPGHSVREDSAIEVLPGDRYVGRGAHKLLGALEAFGLDPAGQVALDLGSSTGGFTEVLLERGAVRVHAVDVGRNQLHERLSRDERVIRHEGVNARRLSLEEIGEPCGFAVMDVSFISVKLILPALRSVLAAKASLAVLVKPQFEVGREEVGKGGLVKHPELWRRCLGEVARCARELGYSVRAACASPLAGSQGNREFFLQLAFEPGSAASELGSLPGRELEGEALERALDAAVAQARLAPESQP